ncbi:MAG: M12 family metallo-peptidase [Rhodanobacteraceae bacterium]
MRSQARGPQGFLWTGRGGDCSALFSAIPNHVRAVISCLNAPYGVETTTAGVQLTRYDAYLPPPDGPLAPEVPVESGGEPQPSSPPGTPTDDQQVDVLVLYTSAVRQAVEAMGMNVQQVMRDEVDTTQMAMDRSTSPGDPVIADVHFVHAAEVSRVDSGEFSLDLEYLRTDPEPVALRNYWAADLVMYVRETTPDPSFCGLAYEPSVGTTPPPGSGFAPYAVGVTKRVCSFSPYGFEHEFAHIFGANHNPESEGNPTPLEPWAYAHWANPLNPDDGHRTIVAYIISACHGQCTQVLNYSNADIYVGAPGDPDRFHTGIADHRENARVIAEFAHTTAQYRASIGRIFADGFE